MSVLSQSPFSNRKVIVLLVVLFLLNGLSFEPASGTSNTSKDSVTTSTIEDVVKDGRITQKYRVGHSGIDIAISENTKILSMIDGQVVRVENEDKFCLGRGYGKLVMMEDESREYTLMYAHLNSQNVEVGDKIEKGDLIGTVGTTGKVTGSHIHLSIYKTDTLKKEDHVCGERLLGETVDPLVYLK